MTSRHSDIFFPSLSRSAHKRSPPPRRDLVSHCHLCKPSPLISGAAGRSTLAPTRGSGDATITWIPSLQSPVPTAIFVTSRPPVYLCRSTSPHFLCRLCPFLSTSEQCTRVGGRGIAVVGGRVAKCHRFGRGHHVLLLSFTHLVATSGPLRAISVRAPLPS